uniref:Putative ovule protein n=1 Tax=Solanum chacoense TaxID=4108 RepID=A0A0V0HBE1_SOLCH
MDSWVSMTSFSVFCLITLFLSYYVLWVLLYDKGIDCIHFGFDLIFVSLIMNKELISSEALH